MKKNLKKTAVLVFLLLIIAFNSSATTMDPPAIEWVKTYFPGYWSNFHSIIETQDGGYAATIGVSSETQYSLYKLTDYGTILWSGRAEIDVQSGRYIIEQVNGDLVLAGWGRETPTSSNGVMIAKYTSDGDELWTKIYNSQYPGSEKAHSIVQLPDGGFAVCGEIDPVEGMNQAWILRTDSQGDTLWTREWGWEAWDRARGVLCIDNAITVLCSGRLEGDPGGTYIVRYSLDGDLLSEYRIPEMQGQYGWDMCRASDGGLLIVNNYHPDITHTDIYGNYDWQFDPPGWGSDYGWSVNTTMDGGIIYGGENAWSEPDGLKSDLSGMISRHDSLGNELWRDYVYNSGCVAIYSIRQLSQGGYIAAGEAWSTENGQQGFLIKYAPEVGIEHQEDFSEVSINFISPNPVSSHTSIEFSLAEPGSASLTLYDLNGRVVETIDEGFYPSDSNVFNWSISEDISNGCYLLRLSTDSETATANVVILR